MTKLSYFALATYECTWLTYCVILKSLPVNYLLYIQRKKEISHGYSRFFKGFIRVFDLQYAEGKHYYDATRRTADDLVAAKTTEEFKKMRADAVTCIVVLNIKDSEPKLLLSHEFRYPTGQFLLSPPAGLIDKEDADLITTATRELKEETGIVFGDSDTAKVISPLLFSTPGMTDESNALVLLSINRDTLPELNTDGAVGSECFNGFSLLTKEEARQILNQGTDSNGIYYSVYTWAALMYFVTSFASLRTLSSRALRALATSSASALSAAEQRRT